MRSLQAGKNFMYVNVKDLLFIQVEDENLFICFYVIDDSDILVYHSLCAVCNILNISASSHKVMESPIICGFCRGRGN